MPAVRSAQLVSVLLLATMTACAPQPVASPSPSRAASADPGSLFLPPGCQPADYRDPQGAVLDLTGKWVNYPLGGPFEPPAPGDTKDSEWIRQAGDCVWGVVFFASPDIPDLEPDAVIWYGTLGSDFVIHATAITITDSDPTNLYRPFTVQVDFAPEGYPVLCLERPDCFTGPADETLEIRSSDLGS
jgi:hypothetical protein